MERIEWAYQVNRLLEAQMLDVLTVEEAEGYWAAGYSVAAAATEIMGVAR